MSEETFKPQLLVLVENRPEAQRLIVTWQKAWDLYSDQPYSGTAVNPEFKEIDPFTERWAAISDVDPIDIEQLCPVLFVNEILWAEGGVDEMALRGVKGRMLEMIGLKS